MKNKLILIIVLFLAITLCATILIACNDENGTADIMQFDGATIDENNKIELSVDKNTKSVNLIDKIILKDGYTWKLYADKMGIVEIPTKIAANPITAELLDGDNEFCIIVSSDDGKQTIVYELAIFRNHDVLVSYVYNNRVVKTDTAETNSEYTISVKGDEDFFDDGFVFNGWTYKDNKTTNINIGKEDIILIADIKGKTTEVSLDANGGELADDTAVITYGQIPTLPLPTKTGYEFIGWFMDTNRFTNAEGQGMSSYEYAYKTQLKVTANWQVRQYYVTASSNDKNVNVSISIDETAYRGNMVLTTYSSNVTVSTTAPDEFIWLGWYDNDNLISTKQSYEFNMPDCDVILQAKWQPPYLLQLTYDIIGLINEDKMNVTVNINKDNLDCGDSLCIVVNDKVTVSSTAPEHFTWLGWYEEDTLVSEDEQYLFAMPARNVILQARWAIYNIKEYLQIADDSPIEKSERYFVRAEEKIYLRAFEYPDNDKFGIWLGWYDNDQLISKEYNYEYIMPYKNVCIIAKYAVLTLNETQGGELFVLDSNGKSITQAKAGETITIKANTFTDYTFKGLYNSDNAFLTNNVEFPYVLPDKNNAISGVWEKYSITVNIESEIETPLLANWYNLNGLQSNHYIYDNQQTTLSVSAECIFNIGLITPDEHNAILIGWFIDGELLSDKTDCTFAMPEKNCSLTLKIVSYPVFNCNIAEAGIINSMATGLIKVGETITVYASVNYGYEFQGWYKDGQLLTSETTLTFTASSACEEYFASYAKCPEGLEYFSYVDDNNGGYIITGIKRVPTTNGSTLTTNIVIPNTVSEIADNAFTQANCVIPFSSFEKLTFGKSVKKIGAKAFDETYYLKTICYIDTLADWCEIEFDEYSNINSRTEKLYIGEELLTDITIPEGITEIKPYAFENCKFIKSITLPNSMRKIGRNAFRGCVNVETIVLNDGLQIIDERAFSLCHKVVSVTILSTVTELNFYAFMNSLRLVEICDKTERHLANKLLNLNLLRIYSEGESYITTNEDGYVFFDDPTNEYAVLIKYEGTQTNILLPTNYNGKQYYINRYAFAHSNLVSVEIANRITSIGEQAFFNCKKLMTAKINGISKIDKFAFESCEELTTFTISGDFYLETLIFMHAKKITNIYFNGSISEWESISKNDTWNDYSGIKTITCSDGVIDLRSDN